MDFLSDSPEDFGTAKMGRPASLRQAPKLRDLATQVKARRAAHGLCSESVKVRRGAFYQCTFEANYAKPTGILGTLEGMSEPESFREGWPTFTSSGKYLGPLTAHCGHDHPPLIGPARTAPSAAYPPQMCRWIAKMICTTKERRCREQQHDVLLGEGEGSLDHLRRLKRRLTPKELLRLTKADPEAITSDEDELGDKREKRGTGSWGRGPPLMVQVGGRIKPFADGAGLCSPGRWAPEKRREFPLTWPKCAVLHTCLKQLLIKEFDVKKTVCELAVGKVKVSPFSPELLERGRELCGAAIDQLHHIADLSVIPAGQCFRLKLIGAMLKSAGDPDWAVYADAKRNFVEGVPLGYREPLPRTPAIFERKVKWRQYNDEELAWAVEGNYGTTSERHEQIAKQFEEEQEQGMMQKSFLDEAKAEWGDNLKIASLADLQKSDQTLRILHDGTHGVLVNPEIRQRDQVPTPGIGEEHPGRSVNEGNKRLWIEGRCQ